ncbi:hypothetical protein ACH4LE_33890 [Streptomyces sp. NPDC017413]|uniref:hypothetical protein n=2 Tax=unclassified Streptomyces TaxID=2593676 RepID=UPI0037ADCBA2
MSALLQAKDWSRMASASPLWCSEGAEVREVGEEGEHDDVAHGGHLDFGHDAAQVIDGSGTGHAPVLAIPYAINRYRRFTD